MSIAHIRLQCDRTMPNGGACPMHIDAGSIEDALTQAIKSGWHFVADRAIGAITGGAECNWHLYWDEAGAWPEEYDAIRDRINVLGCNAPVTSG